MARDNGLFALEAAIREATDLSAPLSPGVSRPNEAVSPNEPETDGSTQEERENDLRKALYGHDFPLANPEMEDDDGAWVAWARGLWTSRGHAVREHLHLVERNRLFRAGKQWISSNGAGPWRPPPRPKDSARVVYNMVDKALDQRLQIITDQRPGFAVTPTTSDPDDKRKAQARQMALEYQFEQQEMEKVGREAAFWAQTDGCAFWHLYWDPDRGPWDERMVDQPEIPDEDGEDGDLTEQEVSIRKPMGDIGNEVLRVEQVRVSPNATATRPPHWMVIREVIPASEAAYRYGATGVQAAGGNQSTGRSHATEDASGMGDWVLSQTTVGEGERLRNEDTVDRFTIYLAPHPDVLPNGLHLIVVGDKVVFGPEDLLWGVIPVVRVTDGSSDPSYFPRPVVEQWLDHQVRLNALLSKWVENIRVNAGGRFLTRPNAVATETFMGGITSMIEVRGAGPMGESIQPIKGFSVGSDVKEALALEKQAFEDASGWNVVSRGQVTGESGRAIIANREQLERVFSPSVNAMARAYTDWAKICVQGMKWGYDMERSLGAVGKSRPDLARSISSADFDGQADVKVEAATMMPMPMAFRLYLLDNWLATGVIDIKEYRRRQMFAIARDMSTPDEDQEARAKRIADAIRLGDKVPELRWQDNEAIHQDVLEREILLQDDLSDSVIDAAQERWVELANQAAQKQGAMVPPAEIQEGAAGAGESQVSPTARPSAPGAIPPQNVPLSANNPAFGTAPIAQQQATGTPDGEILARMADRLSMQ